MSASSGSQGVPQPGISMPQPPSISPKPSSSGWLKGCLLVVAVLVAIVVVVAAIGGYAVYQKAGALSAAFMEKSKPGIMGELAADVTPEQRADFEGAYDKMLKEFRDKGFVNAITIHPQSVGSLQNITADGKITSEEVKMWVEEFNKEETAPAAKK